MQNIKTINFSSTMLMFIVGVLFLVYALLAANALRADYSIEGLKSEIAEVQKDANGLRIRLSEVSSLDYVLERSGTLSYTEIQSVSYIEKSLDSPFAAR